MSKAQTKILKIKISFTSQKVEMGDIDKEWKPLKIYTTNINGTNAELTNDDNSKTVLHKQISIRVRTADSPPTQCFYAMLEIRNFRCIVIIADHITCKLFSTFFYRDSFIIINI